ncbi:MAG: hypothetical protein K8U03_09280 [Planctomycetia bacterium]|nr:hypothetical protein [Planctomycetia bacterium]
MSQRKNAGRPAGAANIKSTVDVQPSQCKKCQSTERSAYFGTPEVQEFSGVRPDGTQYTHIVRRRCTCSACGQVRFDRAYENRKTEDE